jgi:hypothetical protein
MLDRQLPPHPLGPYRRGRGGRPRRNDGPASCRGGHTSVTSRGYILEYSPDHPGANKRGYVAQHRLVLECVHGRLLLPHEIVHHRNRMPGDNRSVNLELHPSRASHQKLHLAEDGVPTKATLTEDQVRRALEGRSTALAAELLGVNHKTLRRRFEHLLAKRRSPGGSFSQEFVRRARELAEDSSIGTRKASALLGTTPNTLRSCCRLHGIEWVSAPPGRPARSR